MKFVKACPAPDCSATRPNFSELSINSLSPIKKEEVKAKYSVNLCYRCSYCGTVWIQIYNEKSFTLEKIVVDHQ